MEMSEILSVGTPLESSVTDGDAKRSVTVRLPASIFFSLNFLWHALTSVLLSVSKCQDMVRL